MIFLVFFLLLLIFFITTFNYATFYFITHHIAKRAAYNVLIMRAKYPAASGAFITAFSMIDPLI